MNRREFLKLLGLSGIAVAMPSLALAELSKLPPEVAEQYKENWSKFDPKATYGCSMPVGDVREKAQRVGAIKKLEEQMITIVPPQYRDKVQYLAFGPGHSGITDIFDELGAIAWKYKP